MATALFHINDNCLQIQQANSFVQSQGYAWLKDDQVVFDLDSSVSAVGHCRLDPQTINSHYWQQCEQSSIPANAANMRHAADLVWQHITQLQQHYNLNDVAFVVPSHYQSSNLQLLLGIARSCQLNVQALLNKSVLALAQVVNADGNYLHIDVQLHQTVCTQVNLDAGVVKLGTIEVIQNVGIQSMYDALLKAIQANFIRNDRFDPLHHAQTEQQLFDQLAVAAKEIQSTGKANISVDHQQRLHTTSIDSKQWQACLAPFTKTLISAGAKYSQVFIDLNNAFSGESLSECEAAGFVSLQTPLLDATSLINDASTGESLVYKTELPVASLQTDTPSANAAPVAEAAANVNAGNKNVAESNQVVTHLLCMGNAVALEHALIGLHNNQLSINHADNGNVNNLLSDGTLFVMNNDSANRNASNLKLNDRLGSNLADGVITAIHVS